MKPWIWLRRSWRISSQEHGGDALGTFCSAKATNEDNYLFQKFVRGVLGTNNIDHCSRLCHAASVAGLQITLGSSAMSNSIAEMKDLEVLLITGSNTSETHPVISTFLREAVVKNGAKLIVIDPRQIEMSQFADYYLQLKAGHGCCPFPGSGSCDCQGKLVDQDFLECQGGGPGGISAIPRTLHTRICRRGLWCSGRPDPPGSSFVWQGRCGCYLLGNGYQSKLSMARITRSLWQIWLC